MSKGYSMHSCVHLWTTHVLNKASSTDLGQLVLRCVGWHLIPRWGRDYWALERRLLQHASHCRDILMAGITIADNDTSALIALSAFFKLQDWVETPEAPFIRALSGREMPDDFQSIKAAHDLGMLYATNGRLDEAEAIFIEILQDHEKTL